MGLTNENQESDQDLKPIKLNRKMRFWNKYKTYIIGAAAGVVIICGGVGVLKTISGNSRKDTAVVAEQSETNKATESTTQATTQAQQQTTQAQQQTTQAPTEPAKQNGSYVVSGTAQSEDFTSKDFYNGAMFLGDSVVDGISYYGYLSSTQVISNGNMTTDKAKDYVSSISGDTSKVFLMVGLNDINYGTRDADAIAGLYGDLVSSVKSTAPNAKIYILSVLPVTKTLEQKQTNKISQSLVDALNNKLSEKASSMGASFIDVSTAFKGDGYMDSSFTGNGSNIYNEYYPFLLNGIAGVLK